MTIFPFGCCFLVVAPDGRRPIPSGDTPKPADATSKCCWDLRTLIRPSISRGETTIVRDLDLLNQRYGLGSYAKIDYYYYYHYYHYYHYHYHYHYDYHYDYDYDYYYCGGHPS